MSTNTEHLRERLTTHRDAISGGWPAAAIGPEVCDDLLHILDLVDELALNLRQLRDIHHGTLTPSAMHNPRTVNPSECKSQSCLVANRTLRKASPATLIRP